MTYNFSLWDKGNVSLSLPESQGGIVATQFFPDAISIKTIAMAEGSSIASAIASENVASEPNDFYYDLRRMVSYINDQKLPTNKIQSFHRVVIAAANSHIKQYGRLIFIDMCSYIDIASHLMYLCEFPKEKIEFWYLCFIEDIINLHKDKVKDAGFMGLLIPFTSTVRYKYLKTAIKQFQITK